jgi:lipopolysaccharide biosynthesis glycosyltransferase
MFNVVYSSNDNYAPYLGISLLSLLENNHDENIYIYIK